MCEDACSKGCHLCLPWYESHTAKLLEELDDCHYRCRADAAHKLGSKLHTDFCCQPKIVGALVHTLQCDPCYVVRKKAAYAIAYQGIHDRCGWSALYLASRLDPHYLVRDGAADALKVLETHVSLDCIREWKQDAERFEKELKKVYKPGNQEWAGAFNLICSCAEPGPAPDSIPLPAEPIAAPKPVIPK